MVKALFEAIKDNLEKDNDPNYEKLEVPIYVNVTKKSQEWKSGKPEEK